MSSKWYPEGYTYPTMPTYIRGAATAGSSGRCKRVPRPQNVIRTTTGGSKRYEGWTNPKTHPMRNSEPDLVDGINYFKIGEIVHVRRYFTRTDEYSAWLPGKVVRPVLTSHENGVNKRLYIVSYVDPYTRQVREKSFAPHLKEIADIPPDTVQRCASLKCKAVHRVRSHSS